MKKKIIKSVFTRKDFLWSILTISAVLMLKKLSPFVKWKDKKLSYIRPPGTTNDETFMDRCIRCRACANVCEAGCIDFFSLTDSLDKAGTPFIDSRNRACNLCMNCTQVCPTGALSPIDRELEAIKENVRMGKAIVIKKHCLSFNGKICGVCKDACPVNAITLKRAQPTVNFDACIGCGRCEERCPQSPTAIFVKRTDLNYA